MQERTLTDSKMKITKRQLRRIIQEEKRQQIKEFSPKWKEAAVDYFDPSGAWISGAGAGIDEEALKALSTEDAWKLFKAIAGAGTDKATVRDVLDRRSNDIPALNDEFNVLRSELIAQRKKFRTWGLNILLGAGPVMNAIMLHLQKRDLVGWLNGDGMKKEAQFVKQQLEQAGKITQLEGRLRGIIREALSTMVSDIAPRRKSSWQAHKERKDASMAANMAKMDAFIKQVADQLKADPASAGDILTTFQPAIELDKHQQSMEGGLRIDAFLDKVEEDLQAQGVDRVAALKFSDSFLKFR